MWGGVGGGEYALEYIYSFGRMKVCAIAKLSLSQSNQKFTYNIF